jgi:CobQ-like glutamine amidotransferase family enzyme
VILQLFPDLLDVNGDAQNALVLARRADWAGLPVELVALRPGEMPSRVPDAVVIGSSVDADLERVRDALGAIDAAVREWLARGVPILAVGTGFELLTEGIERPGHPFLEGLGLLPGRAVPRAERAVGDLVVDLPEGRAVGFENHSRDLVLPPSAAPLGAVVAGVGNEGRTEGAREGSMWGTHLHGPVLAKNPALADALLVAAFGDAYRPDDARIRFVDDVAATAREAILRRLGLA